MHGLGFCMVVNWALQAVLLGLFFLLSRLALLGLLLRIRVLPPLGFRGFELEVKTLLRGSGDFASRVISPLN